MSAPDENPPSRSRARTYALVLLVHAATITALWAFSYCFGTP